MIMIQLLKLKPKDWLKNRLLLQKQKEVEELQ